MKYAPLNKYALQQNSHCATRLTAVRSTRLCSPPDDSGGMSAPVYVLIVTTGRYPLHRLVQRQFHLAATFHSPDPRPLDRRFLSGQRHIARLMPVTRDLAIRLTLITLATQPRDF